MEVASCTVNLAGNVYHQVVKGAITPAEALILNHIHGEGSVVDLKRHTNDKRSHQAEMDRLGNLYKERKVRELFPGLNPSLPVTFADAGIEIENDITPSAGQRRKRKPKSDAPQHDGEGAEDATAEAVAAVPAPKAAEPKKAEAPEDDLAVPAFLKRTPVEKPATT